MSFPTSSNVRRATLAPALGRSAIGAMAVLAPGVVARPWVGGSGSGPETGVLARGLGGRDLALGLGAILALRHDRPVRGWLEGGALADLTDALATAVNFRSLPARSRWAILAAAVSGSGIGAVLARRIDR